MTVTGTTSVPAQKPQPAVTSPSPATVSHSESSATVQSIVNTSAFRILRYSRPSTTTPVVESTRIIEPFLSRDRRRQEEIRHRFRTVQRSEHRQYDRQHQSSAPSQRPSGGSVTDTTTGYPPPRPRSSSSRDDRDQLELIRRRRVDTERELEKLRREEAHLKRHHRDT